MKIVQIEDFFHPDAGYQVNVLSKYLVQFGHEVTIITGDLAHAPEHLVSFFGSKDIQERDQQYEKKYGAKIIRVAVKKYVSGRAVFDKSIFQLIQKERPDILYVHGNDTLIAMQVFMKHLRINCPIISDSHMLPMASNNKLRYLFRLFYRLTIAPIINKHKIIVIKTTDDPYVNDKLGVSRNLTPFVSFGSDTLLFHPSRETRVHERRELNIGENEFVFIYAGKIDNAKGGVFLAKAICDKFSLQRNVVFLIIGTPSKESEKETDALFSSSKNRIIRLPTQKYEDLAKFYQSSDVALFPRQCSLSFFDVQACGLPVLSEKNSINLERNSHGNGICFSGGSIEDFRARIQDFANMPSADFDKMSDNSKRFIERNYDYKVKAREYEHFLLISRNVTNSLNKK